MGEMAARLAKVPSGDVEHACRGSGNLACVLPHCVGEDCATAEALCGCRERVRPHNECAVYRLWSSLLPAAMGPQRSAETLLLVAIAAAAAAAFCAGAVALSAPASAPAPQPQPIFEDLEDLRSGVTWLCRHACKGRIFCQLCPTTTTAEPPTSSTTTAAPSTTAKPAAAASAAPAAGNTTSAGK